MSKNVRGFVQLGSRRLRFDFAALDALEQETGSTVQEIVEGFSDGRLPSMRRLATITKHGLTHDAPGITENEAGDALIDVGIKPAMEIVFAALVASFGLTDEDMGNGQTAEKT